jgi:8-oxo-dGTP pyrophosphatase MutT (NUDIX family)
MALPVDDSLRRRMQVSLFVVFLAIFVATSTLTLASLFYNVGNLSQGQKDLLVKATLGEVAAGIVALFYALFGLRNKPGSAEDSIPKQSNGSENWAKLLLQTAGSPLRESAVLSALADPSSNVTVGNLARDDSNGTGIGSAIPEVQAVAISVLLRDLGLVKIDERGVPRPVSELASCFLRSMSAHLREELEFIGGWTEEGRENPRAQVPRRILRSIEERRVESVGRDRAAPSRVAQSAIALIKAERNGESVYLTQLSDSWGEPYYWFIGGVRETSDRDILDCLHRELREELNFTRSDVLFAKQMRIVFDRRISERLGAFTEYRYEVFFVQLESDSKAVSVLCRPFPEVETYHGMAKFLRKNKWQTWAELESDPNLRKHALVLLEALKNDVAKLPPSVSWKIAV